MGYIDSWTLPSFENWIGILHKEKRGHDADDGDDDDGVVGVVYQSYVVALELQWETLRNDGEKVCGVAVAAYCEGHPQILGHVDSPLYQHD